MSDNSLTYYILLAIFGTGGIGGLAQLGHYIVARRRNKPEVDNIITEGARNAVESLQIALEQSQKEVVELRSEMDELKAKHREEIEKLNDQLDNARQLLGAAQQQIGLLSIDLTRLRDEVRGVIK